MDVPEILYPIRVFAPPRRLPVFPTNPLPGQLTFWLEAGVERKLQPPACRAPGMAVGGATPTLTSRGARRESKFAHAPSHVLLPDVAARVLLALQAAILARVGPPPPCCPPSYSAVPACAALCAWPAPTPRPPPPPPPPLRARGRCPSRSPHPRRFGRRSRSRPRRGRRSPVPTRTRALCPSPMRSGRKPPNLGSPTPDQDHAIGVPRVLDRRTPFLILFPCVAWNLSLTTSPPPGPSARNPRPKGWPCTPTPNSVFRIPGHLSLCDLPGLEHCVLKAGPGEAPPVGSILFLRKEGSKACLRTPASSLSLLPRPVSLLGRPRPRQPGTGLQ